MDLALNGYVMPLRSVAFRYVVLGCVAALCSGCSGSWSSSQGKTISPDGAAYSYKVPHGFFVENTSDFVDKLGRENQTGVHFPLGAAVVRVSEQTLSPAPTDLAKVQQAYVAQASRWDNPATDWRRLTTADAPALRYHLVGRSRDGKHQEAEETVVFKGSHLVYVSCNWESSSDKSHALEGCEAVLKSLRIKG